jgi:hypothetical protein
VCRLVVGAFALAYLLALALAAIGTFGLFGQEPDALSAIGVVVLGLPWNRLADLAPEPWWPWLAVAAPLLNLLLLAGACRVLRRLIG